MKQKHHRIVDANFSQWISSRQAMVAIEAAENEGWPMLPASAEALPSMAKASAVHRAAYQVMNHFHDEYRFWSGRSAIVRAASR